MENSTSQNPPDNNLVWAILCTVLCCLPLGVVEIIKSTSVNSLWSQGKHAEAQKAADDTKKYAKMGSNYRRQSIYRVFYRLFSDYWSNTFNRVLKF